MSDFRRHINFANGQPNDSILPRELLQEAASGLLASAPPPAAQSSVPLNYGDNPSTFRNSE
jgi:hypothetical protein